MAEKFIVPKEVDQNKPRSW